jgi:hypothetical protein
MDGLHDMLGPWASQAPFVQVMTVSHPGVLAFPHSHTRPSKTQVAPALGVRGHRRGGPASTTDPSACPPLDAPASIEPLLDALTPLLVEDDEVPLLDETPELVPGVPVVPLLALLELPLLVPLDPLLVTPLVVPTALLLVPVPEPPSLADPESPPSLSDPEVVNDDPPHAATSTAPTTQASPRMPMRLSEQMAPASDANESG